MKYYQQNKQNYSINTSLIFYAVIAVLSLSVNIESFTTIPSHAFPSPCCGRIATVRKTPSSSSSLSSVILNARFGITENHQKDVLKTTRNDQAERMDKNLSLTNFFKNGNKEMMTNAADEAWSAMDEISDNNEGNQFLKIEAIILISAVALVGGLISQNPTATSTIQNIIADPTTTLSTLSSQISSMGNIGILYFGIIYTIAELLAIPATPLTASAGYLFGVPVGTAVVLISASISAGFSFLLGRTLFRETVEGLLEQYPEFKALDKAIGKEGFKIILLLRLSPLFPFSLSNYLYGVTSVQFWPYFFATLLGFTPGTIAYVYTGTLGKTLTLDGGGDQPWYVYVGGLALLVGLLKFVADIATDAINNLEDDE